MKIAYVVNEYPKVVNTIICREIGAPARVPQRHLVDTEAARLKKLFERALLQAAE